MPVKEQMFTDVHWVGSRINGTYVLDAENNRLVRVLGMNGRKFIVFDPEKNDEFTKELSELDLRPPALGMVDVGTNCFWVCRQPKRNDWRQGLRTGNCIVRSMTPYGVLPMNVREIFTYCNQPVQNTYLSLSEAVEKVQDKFEVRALSRDFALDDRGVVLYRNSIEVGKINPEETGVILKPKFQYLKENLLETVKGVSEC